MKKVNTREHVSELILNKLTVKREVFEKTKQVFGLLKEALNEVKEDLKIRTKTVYPIVIEVSDSGEYETRIKVGGDTLIFLMHSNVFDFEPSHRIHQNSYLKEAPYQSFCGQIYMYNFLSDSFKYNRSNDLGYLIARLFVNKDLHYFVEGRQRLSFLFNDFQNATIDKKALANIIDEVLKECLEFDLFSPPYKQVEMVTVDEINQVSNDLKIQTGKRLGFKFSADENNPRI